MQKSNSPRWTPKKITLLLKKLKQRAKTLPPPMSTQLAHEFDNDPFILLISCLLSLRTRDSVTYPVCKKLFALAKTPQQMLALPLKTIEKVVHSLGFYRRKARLVHSVSKDILTRFHGKVPANKDDLLSINGVGPKTANLVLAQAFGIPAICVDTHVHRIANKLGLVHTKTPQQTEAALEKIIPKKYWIEFNPLLVAWGQNRCKNQDNCHVHDICQQIYKLKKLHA